MFDFLRRIMIKKLKFDFFIPRLPEKLFEKLYEEVQSINADLNTCTIRSNKLKHLGCVGLKSIKSLQVLTKFNSLTLHFESVNLPKDFGYKLVYLHLIKLLIKLKALNRKIAFQIMFKNFSKSLKVKFYEVKKSKSLLPLFIKPSLAKKESFFNNTR